MDINVQGTVRVLECARRAGVEKLVYAASSSCYGLAETPTRKIIRSVRISLCLSKYQGEQAAFHWRQVYALPVNTISIFNAYGTRVRTTAPMAPSSGLFPPEARRQAFHGGRRRHQRRDFVYVTDVAKLFWRRLKQILSGTASTSGGPSAFSQ